MLDCFEKKTWTNLELVEAFDYLDDAKDFFEDEKRYCRSRYTKYSTDNLVLFDVLTLEETEYDEDGDYIQGDQLDIFIADIKSKKIV